MSSAPFHVVHRHVDHECCASGRCSSAVVFAHSKQEVGLDGIARDNFSAAETKLLYEWENGKFAAWLAERPRSAADYEQLCVELGTPGILLLVCWQFTPQAHPMSAELLDWGDALNAAQAIVSRHLLHKTPFAEAAEDEDIVCVDELLHTRL